MVVFAYLSFHVSTNNKNVVFGNVSDKGRLLVVEGDKDHIFLTWIFLMLLSDFEVQGLRSIPTSPLMALTEFLNADAETNVLPLPVLWYFISTSLW